MALCCKIRQTTCHRSDHKQNIASTKSSRSPGNVSHRRVDHANLAGRCARHAGSSHVTRVLTSADFAFLYPAWPSRLEPQPFAVLRVSAKRGRWTAFGVTAALTHEWAGAMRTVTSMKVGRLKAGLLVVGGVALAGCTQQATAPSSGNAVSATPAPTVTVTQTAAPAQPPVVVNVEPAPVVTQTVVVEPESAGDGTRWPPYTYVGMYNLCYSATYPNAGLLREGDEGGAVAESLQAALISLGYDGVAVTGYYGPSTTAAVKRFQSNHGLVADGTIGQQTWSALQARLYHWGKC